MLIEKSRKIYICKFRISKAITNFFSEVHKLVGTRVKPDRIALGPTHNQSNGAYFIRQYHPLLLTHTGSGCHVRQDFPPSEGCIFLMNPIFMWAMSQKSKLPPPITKKLRASLATLMTLGNGKHKNQF